PELLRLTVGLKLVPVLFTHLDTAGLFSLQVTTVFSPPVEVELLFTLLTLFPATKKFPLVPLLTTIFVSSSGSPPFPFNTIFSDTEPLCPTQLTTGFDPPARLIEGE